MSESQYRDRASVSGGGGGGVGGTRPTERPTGPGYSDSADPRRMAKQEPDHRLGPDSRDRYAHVPPPNPSREEARYSEDRPRAPSQNYRDYAREDVVGRGSYSGPTPVHPPPPPPPAPRSPSGIRDDYRRPPDLPQPLPMALPIAPQVQPMPMLDPATVHATLDILKAQIARLEAMLPAIPPSQPTYSYDPYRPTPGPAPGSIPIPTSVAAQPIPVSMPVAASPASPISVPPQPASGYRLEWDERRREYSYVYEPRRADSPPPPSGPPPPGPRGYRYELEPHRAPPSGPGVPPPRPSDRERERERQYEPARPRSRSPPPHQHTPRAPSVSVSASMNHPSRDLQNRIEPT